MVSLFLNVLEGKPKIMYPLFNDLSGNTEGYPTTSATKFY